MEDRDGRFGFEHKTKLAAVGFPVKREETGIGDRGSGGEGLGFRGRHVGSLLAFGGNGER